MQSVKKDKADRKGFYIFCIILLFCVGLAIFTTAGNSVLAADYIAVLDIKGTISQNDGYTYDQQYLLDSVEELTADSHNKGLLLRINMLLRTFPLIQPQKGPFQRFPYFHRKLFEEAVQDPFLLYTRLHLRQVCFPLHPCHRSRYQRSLLFLHIFCQDKGTTLF